MAEPSLPNPPRLAEWLLAHLLPDEEWETPLGDFAEYYRMQCRRASVRRAQLWYWQQVLELIPRRFVSTVYWSLIMFKSYVRTALRHMRRHIGYTTLNIVGLSVGLAVCLLIALFVQHELGFDQFHQQEDQIYRVLQARSDRQDAQADEHMSPGFAPALMAGIPEIQHAVRFIARSGSLVSREDGSLSTYEKDFIYADSNFFDVFTFPLIKGDPTTALDRPMTVVVTERAAQTYFGDADPIGQTLLYNNTHRFEVTGVAANLPPQSSIRFDFLVSFATIRAIPEEAPMFNSGWGVSAYPTYVLLRKEATVPAVEEKISVVLQQHTDAEHVLNASFRLESITDVYLHSAGNNQLGPQSDIRYIYIFSALAILILLIACINYMNMATARSAGRAREVGVRKVVGAYRGQLAGQFLSESMFTSLMAMVLAVGLVRLTLPIFADLLQREISVALLSHPVVILTLLGVVAFVGFLSGSYPALLLSRFIPAEVLKGKFTHSSSGAAFRKGLVVFQFTVSVALIASTLVIYSQLDYVRNKRLGLNPEQVMVLSLQGETVSKPSSIAQQPDAFRSELENIAAVEHVAYATTVPTRRGSRFGYRATEDEPWAYVHSYQITPSFLPTLGMEMLAGEDYNTTLPPQPTDVLLNETAMRLFGWNNATEALGQIVPLRLGRDPLTVRGIVQDFHFQSLHQTIQPVAFRPIGERRPRYVIMRVQAAELQQTVQRVEALWQQFSPEHPFTYFFLDDAFDQLYQTEDRLARVFNIFTLIAIVIACLGLFGLAAYSAEQRTKEIGIRKVFGATVVNLVGLLSKDFLKLVTVSFVFAIPLAYAAMQRWLEDFAYRIDLGWGVFALAGVLALGIALATVSYQAIRAALANPIDSLRYE